MKMGTSQPVDNLSSTMKYLNTNLITLKCVLFFFFGGLGCLYPFLPLHMSAKGLSHDEKKIISYVAPCVALLGPAIAGPLADKLAGGSGGTPRSKTGTYLRVMMAVCFLLSAAIYWLLMAVPTIAPWCEIATISSSHSCNYTRNPAMDDKNLTVRSHEIPIARLQCNRKGGFIEVTKCLPSLSCANWTSDNVASFSVKSCTYTCETGMAEIPATTVNPEDDTSDSALEYDDHYDEGALGQEPIESRPIHPHHILKHIPNPHLCYLNEKNESFCNVYSSHSNPVNLRLHLIPNQNVSKQNEEATNVCTYYIGDNFHCRMGPKFEDNGTVDLTTTCNPTIKCAVHDPPKKKESIFVETECSVNTSSFWWYLVIRSIADIFPAAAVALLDAAIIIATRETSTGRGDAGKQFAVGALGLAIFAPIVGAIGLQVVALTLFSVFMVIAAIIVLIDSNMPLSPPEWWWHTRCGLLALPMSSIRKYGLETAALGVILLFLGIFWNGIDPFLSWHIVDLRGTGLNIGLTITVGALPAVFFLIFIEKILDYCGHTNLLIASFTFYIIYYSVLTIIEEPWLFLLCEALEIFTLHVMWVTAVLYLRHLVPKRFTVSGQALPVITHFCIGRLIGAALGGLAYPRKDQNVKEVYEGFAAAAAVIAVFYFVLYHFWLKPKCAAPVVEERPTPALIQNVNGNGTYTPLRVYHNGRAKKGQFKY